MKIEKLSPLRLFALKNSHLCHENSLKNKKIEGLAVTDLFKILLFSEEITRNKDTTR